MISIVKTRDNELEFDINITGAQKKEPVVRLIIENDKVNYTFDCTNLKGDKWVCAIPPMPQLTKKAYPFRLEVIIDGYFFEPYRKTINIIPEPVVKSGKVAEKHPEKPVVKDKIVKDKEETKEKSTEPKKKVSTTKRTEAKPAKRVVAKEETYIPPVKPVEQEEDNFADLANKWLNRDKPVLSEKDKKIKGVIRDALEPRPVLQEPVQEPIQVPEIPKSALDEHAEKAKLNDIKIKAILDSAKST